MTHQTKQLQLLAGSPIDKYSFPATRGQEIGWWLTKEKKSMEAGNGADVPPNVSIDAKIGRWARGQGSK